MSFFLPYALFFFLSVGWSSFLIPPLRLLKIVAGSLVLSYFWCLLLQLDPGTWTPRAVIVWLPLFPSFLPCADVSAPSPPEDTSAFTPSLHFSLHSLISRFPLLIAFRSLRSLAIFKFSLSVWVSSHICIRNCPVSDFSEDDGQILSCENVNFLHFIVNIKLPITCQLSS